VGRVEGDAPFFHSVVASSNVLWGITNSGLGPL